jgi:hypothetical protein
MGLVASETFKPILFVGLGGNGGKIVNQLAARLRRHPHWDRISRLTHFVAIDTNKDDLDKHRDISPDCRFLISNFDARKYVERKRGEHEVSEDKLFTSWFPHNYTPRSGETPGAGQIRLESRLKLYYNLEQDRAGIRQKIRAILNEMTGRENPWRDNEDRTVRINVFGSVAGGTGSGGFIPMAYLLKQMVYENGWGRPNIQAMMSLPTTFLDKVHPRLHKDINANGYAALKELEYLTRQLAYAGGVDKYDFVYDPGNSDPRANTIDTRPFTLTYFIDKPDALSLQKYEAAVSDAAYLQIFSPLLGAQAGEYDNYEKHQRTLANGNFSTHYGAFGTAILQFPRRDIIRYSSLRYTGRAFRQFLAFGADHPDFRVPYGDPAFERLDPAEKERRIDEKFEGYVKWRAGIELSNDEKGVFRGIEEQNGKGGVPLREAFTQVMSGIYGQLDELIDISEVVPQSISPGNPSVSNAVSVLRREYAESRAKVRGEYLEASLADLRTGRVFGKFFQDFDINPIAQRLFLIRLLRETAISPSEDPEEGEELISEVAKPDLDSEAVKQERQRHEQALVSAANQGFFGRVIDRENKAFMAAKRASIRTVNEWVQDHVDDLRHGFWRSYQAELRQVANTLLQTFRNVAEVANEAADLVDSECERFQRDPGAFPDSDIAQYYLDAEVLRDDRRKERLWGAFYTHNLDKSALFDSGKIFTVVTESFQPVRDPDGRVRARDASDIVSVVKTALMEMAAQTYGVALEDIGMDLVRGLDLEQRYIALMDDGHDIQDLKESVKLDETLAAVSETRIRKGIEDRISRLDAEAVILAHIDKARSGGDVVPAYIHYAGLASQYRSDEDGSLGSILADVVSGVTFVDGWEERDSLVLYRATLGVPIYWFKNVEARLQHDYEQVWASDNRQYPLHIDTRWENEPGLPNLDPIAIRRADEKAQAERAAQKQQSGLEDRLRVFSLCTLFGGISHSDVGYAWNSSGASAPLAASRPEAFQAFSSLDADLRSDIESEAQAQWTRLTADKRGRERLAQDVNSHAAKLKEAYANALAADNERDKQFLKQERPVVDAMLGELE